MHGLVNCAIQGFVTDTCGLPAWDRVTRTSGTGFARFEAMELYDDHVTARLLGAVERVLGKPLSRILEDIGSWLVASGRPGTVRRLLRFGGEEFEEFLHSLGDLPGRTRLAVEGFDLPAIEVIEVEPHTFRIQLTGTRGFGHVLFGLLHAMADDYGALAVIDQADPVPGGEVLAVRVFQSNYSAGRDFRLGQGRT